MRRLLLTLFISILPIAAFASYTPASSTQQSTFNNVQSGSATQNRVVVADDDNGSSDSGSSSDSGNSGDSGDSGSSDSGSDSGGNSGGY